MTAPLLIRLTAQERAFMVRCVLAPGTPWSSRAAWTGVTHLGGTGASILAACLPLLLACCSLQHGARLALAALVISHLLVQIVKRTVVRPRPSELDVCASLVKQPDRFSFPSGHATASMSVALSYGVTFPVWAVPLLLLALLVGFSRVRLGVHYPSDVVVGQLIAACTVAALTSTI